MKLSEEEVRYVAALANLRLSDEEVHRTSHDLGQVLTHIEQLNELDTQGINPMTQVLFEEDETASLREDIPRATLTTAEALQNAPQSGGGYFKVPKVIDR
ncbi:MAG TPA: Asp-tRNA(Asn)/Glu-tRNA(Gln) amidotransferase subunit GatC [Bryobacteraceae bacterium]|nr:Asp-tRNA(Asn)/Glu-tRNA(Gln) amidotransferase subunit GatC [Bryobacteraceae bacterium]